MFQNIKSYLNTTNKATLPGCFNDDALVFTQVKCFETEQYKSNKRTIALSFSCLGVFGCVTYLIIMYYRLFVNQIDFKLWDMKTVTANDFTVELKITDDLWEKFLSHEGDICTPSQTRASKFQAYFTNLIETRIEEDTGVRQEIALVDFDFQ